MTPCGGHVRGANRRQSVHDLLHQPRCHGVQAGCPAKGPVGVGTAGLSHGSKLRCNGPQSIPPMT